MPFFINRPIMPLSAGITFATFDPARKNTTAILSGGNLTYAATNGNAYSTAAVTVGKSSGKYYAELLCNASNVSQDSAIGIATGAFDFAAATNLPGPDANGFSALRDGSIWGGSGVGGAWDGFGANILDAAIDFGAKLFWWRVNNGLWNSQLNGGSGGDPASGTFGYDFTSIGSAPFYFVVSGYGFSSPPTGFTANFGASAFTRTPPSGFVGLS